MLQTMPKQVSLPERKILSTRQQIFDYINLYNGIKDFYFSLYNCDQNGSYENCKLDKIYFDIDNGHSYENVDKLHFYCKLHNLQHSIYFSGNGFWFFIYTSNYNNIKNKSGCLKNAQLLLLKEANVVKTDVDLKCSDIARVCRFPATQNLKALNRENRISFARFLTEEEFKQGLGFIKELSKTQDVSYYQNPKKYVLNELKYDIAMFDKPCEELFISVEIQNFNFKVNDEKIKNFPPCVKNILLKIYVTWDEQFVSINYMMNKGYTRDECMKVMDKYMENKIDPKIGVPNYPSWRRLVVKHVNNVYRRQHLVWGCNSVKSKGMCPVKNICSEIQNLYVIV